MDTLLGPSWDLSKPDLLQQLAMLGWLGGVPGSEQALQGLTAVRVAYGLWRRLDSRAEIDRYKAECIAGIVAFIRSNPRASRDVLDRALEKQVCIFAARVQAMG